MSPNDRSSESGLRDYCKAEFFNTIGRLRTGSGAGV